jgi:hypothetical protein
MLSLVTPYEVAQNPGRGTEVVDAVNNMVTESWQRAQQWNLIEKMDTNLRLHLYGRTSDAPARAYEVNLIGDVNLANSAIQVGERPTITVTPRETGEPKIYYLNPNYIAGPGAMPDAFLSQLKFISPEAMDPNDQQPLNSNEVALLQDLIEQGEVATQRAMQLGAPKPIGVIPQDILITIDDHAMGDAAKTLLDIKTEDSGLKYGLVENGQYHNIFGYQFFVAEFDSDTLLHIYRNPEPIVLHVDPFNTNIRKSQYVIYDEFLGAEEAAQLYPDLTDVIEKNATQGPPTIPGVTPQMLPMPWYQSLMGRSVIVIRNAWLRNQPYKLTVQEALAAGKIIGRPTAAKPTEEKKPGIASSFMQKALSIFGMGTKPADDTISLSQNMTAQTLSPEGDGDGAATTAEDQRERNTGTQGTADLAATPDAPVDPVGDSSAEADGAGAVPAEGDAGAGNGQAGSEPGTPPQNTRLAYYLVKRDGSPDLDTGEVTPDHKKWPIRRAIRQIKIVASTLVEDAECKRANIPVGQNVARILPFTPWGQSDAELLEPVNRAFNDTFSDNIQHGTVNAFPPTILSQSMANKYPELARSGRVAARRMFPVDDDTIRRVGIDKLLFPVKIGELPEDNWKRLSFLQSLFKERSQQAEILRGELPGQSAMSGEAIGQLQSYAKSTIQFKGLQMEDMLEYLGPVILGDYLMGMTTQQLAECVRKYPPVVWPELHRRLLRHYLSCAIKFSLKSGSGATSRGETQDMMQSAQLGVPWSPQTLIERMNGDPDTELTNAITWERKKQAAIQQAQPAGMGQPAQPQQPQPQPA